MSEIRRNVLIVGDSRTGKTCLSEVFANGTFPEFYRYGICETYFKDVEVYGKHVELTLIDIFGGEYSLHDTAYRHSHVILICFAIDDPHSLDNVQDKWILEVERRFPNVPILLVGCKKDLRRNSRVIEKLRITGGRLITRKEGRAVAQEIGAKHYLECSGQTGYGVDVVFHYATLTALPKSRWSRVVKQASTIIKSIRSSIPERASTSSVRKDDPNSSNTSLSVLSTSAINSPFIPPSPKIDAPYFDNYVVTSSESSARSSLVWDDDPEYLACEASSPVLDNDFLEPLKAFNSLVKGLAGIHPYVKVTLTVFSWASQGMLAQANQDKSTQDLQSRIADVYEFMLEDGRLKELISMQDILSQGSQVVYECAKFIQVYSQPNVPSRLSKGVFSGTDEAVAKYTNAIENLMQLFHQYDPLFYTDDILTTTHNIRQNIRHALEDIGQSGDNQLLDIISYAEGAGLDTIKVCLDGTREEILHEVINWIDDADPNTPCIFWLYGTACTGKSAIACTIAHAMKDSGALGSYFCFEKGDVKRHTKLFSTIACDLAIGDVWLKQALANVVAGDASVATTADVMQQWEKLIKEPLSAISGDIIGRVVIVIDALDESGDPPTRAHILSLLAKQAFALPDNVRILITSRPLPDIREAFDGAFHIKHMSMDEIPMSSTERDIQIYISDQLRDADYSFSADEIMALAEKSDGLFGWAHLACDHIMSDTVGLSKHERYKKLMSQTESGGTKLLDDMYHVTLKEIVGDRPEELGRFRSVMRHILYTLEPLTLEALTTMHQTAQPEQDKYDADLILRSMGSLITGIHDRFMPIRPLHYSFREFLLDQDRSGPFFVDRDDGDDNSNATRRLLESMTKSLIGHADKLNKQPDFHGTDHFVPDIGNLMNRNLQAIEDWKEILGPLLNVLDKLLVPSNFESLKDGYCQECRFFQITRDTLTYFQTLRQREDPDVEKYVKSLEEIIRYGDAGNFDMNFGRVYSSAAIVGLMMAILAHLR